MGSVHGNGEGAIMMRDDSQSDEAIGAATKGDGGIVFKATRDLDSVRREDLVATDEVGE